jgi:hypothetical protein
MTHDTRADVLTTICSLGLGLRHRIVEKIPI